jgi:hypothetical protein
VVRDPRKKLHKVSSSVAVAPRAGHEHPEVPPPQHHVVQRSPLPFEPSQYNQQSVGSSLASYALAGVGVTMGVVLVRLVLGF